MKKNTVENKATEAVKCSSGETNHQHRITRTSRVISSFDSVVYFSLVKISLTESFSHVQETCS